MSSLQQQLQQQFEQHRQQQQTSTATTVEKCCYSSRRRLLRFHATVLLSASIAYSILASTVIDATPSMHALRGGGSGADYYTAVAEGPAESDETAYMLRSYLRSLQELNGGGPGLAYDASPDAPYLSAPEMVGEATRRNGANGGYLLIEDLKSAKRGLGPRPLRFGK